MERFAPQVVINGATVTPEGWMWVLSFALAGCAWAIKEADTPEFREQIRDYFRRRAIYFVEQDIASLEQRLAIAKQHLGSLEAGNG